MDIRDHLQTVNRRIRQAERQSGRQPHSVKLVAVSKTFPAEDVQACYDAGQSTFGENRVQEALAKIPLVDSNADWHLIGPLQKNKVRKALGAFTLIHSVDSYKLAAYMNGIASELDIKARILLEVHIGGETTKFGFAPEALKNEWDNLNNLANLSIEGLMCIPPPVDDPEQSRPHFRTLRQLRDSLATDSQPLAELSMGMSHDFEVAIDEGSTLVRIGTAIFGGRG